MINELIQYLKSSKAFGNKFKSNDIQFILLTSGGYRKYAKSRIVVIIFDGSKPILVMKFYKNSDSISDEFKTQNQIYDIYGDLISKPLGIEYCNDYNLFIEEPVLGKNLTRHVYENLNQNSLVEIFTNLFTFYGHLNSHLEPSNIENFIKEIDLVFQNFYSHFKISNSHKDMIEYLKLEFIKNFENKNIFQRFSNCDFILNNFIINDNNMTLTDFEFSKKTHLYFLEWFQLFRYQWITSNSYIHDLTISEISEPFYNLGLKEFSNYKTNEKFELSCRLIFEITDFIKRIDVSSLSTCNTLIRDMEVFLNELSSRFDTPNIKQKKPNLEDSEKEFFKKEHDKLIQYKNNNDELIDIRISNDEYKLKLKKTFEELDKIRRDFDTEKYLNEHLRNHNDELRKELDNTRNHNDELRKELDNTRNHNDELRKEIKRMVSDHENYKNSIENSSLWKLLKNFDKLSGKKQSD